VSDDRLHQAIDYAERGFAVVPLHSVRNGVCTCRRRSRCGKKAGKHPRTRHGVKDATTNTRRLWDWWLKWPDSNVGLATGDRGGLLVLDVDPRNGGDATLDRAEADLGRLPECPTSRTGGGGWHRLFAYPGPGRLRSTLGPGVDIQGDGKLIVAPSSMHRNGNPYTWIVPLDRELPTLPSAWLEACQAGGDSTLNPHFSPPDGVYLTQEDTGGVGGGLGEFSSAVNAVIQRTLPAAYGQRHRQVFELARALKGLLPSASARDLEGVVLKWHRLALPHISTKPFSETWIDFLDSWQRVKFPKGVTMNVILEKAAATVPSCAMKAKYTTEIRLLVSICRQLQMNAGNGTFFLSCRMAGEMLGVSHWMAARWLRLLVYEEILKRESDDDLRTHQAAEYRYLGD